VVNLGSHVRDNLTGFEGTAIARITHLYGCVHIAILPKELKDGAPQKERVFDEQRVEVITDSGRQARTPKVELGNTVKDKLTGLTGIVTTWYDEYTSITFVGVTPKELHEGKPIDALYFPEDRIELFDDTKPVVSPSSSATSGSIAGEFSLSTSRLSR